MLPVLLDFCAQGRLSVEKVVRMGAERPSELYGIANKGYIKSGFDADLAIVDLSADFAVTEDWLKSKCGWSPYEGRTLTGKPVHTIVNGRVVVKDSEPTRAFEGRMVEFTWKPRT